MLTDFVTGLRADWPYWAGLTAAVLSVIAFAPYIYHTITGQTRPDRATWLIWSVLASISGASNLYEGATASLPFVMVQVGGTLIVFVLSIPRGHGQLLSPGNGVILAASGVGLLAWYLTHTAVYALALSIAISAVGGAATTRKAYLMPHSETLSTWVLSVVAAFFGVVSVAAFDPLLLAYPLYLLVLYLGIVVAMLLARAQDAQLRRVVWYSGRAAASRLAMAEAGPVLEGPPAAGGLY